MPSALKGGGSLPSLAPIIKSTFISGSLVLSISPTITLSVPDGIMPIFELWAALSKRSVYSSRVRGAEPLIVCIVSIIEETVFQQPMFS